jgi:acetylglutamate kinase
VNLLVKIGGTLLDQDASRQAICGQVARLAQQRLWKVAVVHGGGKQMTRFLEERGVKSEFVDGLRVSSPEVIDAVLKVFAGSVNHGLVGSLVKAGAKAVGLTGVDCALVECEVLNERLGQVGRPVRTNTKVLADLCGMDYLPVVACVGGDRHGNVYNVNADQMASAIAKGWGAKRLLFLTDVEGVRGGDGKAIAVLSAAGARGLMDSGVASGGMLAKLRYAMEALAAGVEEVRIVNGAVEGVVERVMAGEELGTAIVS